MPPVLQLGGMCALRDGNRSGGSGGGMGTVCAREELTSRLGLEAVQRLAKDGCRLLQNHNYRLPDRNQAVSRVLLYWLYYQKIFCILQYTIYAILSAKRVF